jgi:hypothetical protein
MTPSLAASPSGGASASGDAGDGDVELELHAKKHEMNAT